MFTQQATWLMARSALRDRRQCQRFDSIYVAVCSNKVLTGQKENHIVLPFIMVQMLIMASTENKQWKINTFAFKFTINSNDACKPSTNIILEMLFSFLPFKWKLLCSGKLWMAVINFSLILHSQTKRTGYGTKSHWWEIKEALQPWPPKANDWKL